MKHIQIANVPELQAIVDDADFDYLSGFRWLVYRHQQGYEYAVAQVEGKRNYMHRLLCGKPGLVVDHINGNTLDNRRENLRAVSSMENNHNRHAATKNNTGEKFIYQMRWGSFIVRIVRDRKTNYLGSFPTIEQAKVARDAFLSGSLTVRELLKRIAQLESELAQLRGVAA